MEVNMDNKSDHDLLVEVNTTLKRVVMDIRDLKDGTSIQLANNTSRIEFLERWKSSIGTYLWIYGIVGGFLATLLIYHLAIK